MSSFISLPRFKSGIVHQQRRPLPLSSSKLPLILHCMRAADLLGFPSPQIGMVFLLSLSKLLLIILLCLGLVLMLILKSVSAKLCRTNFRFLKKIILGTLSLVLLEYKLDYKGTFTPMAKITIVLIVTTIVVSKGWSLRKMDEKNVFLHGDLKEELFMCPLLGLFPSSFVEFFCLKQFLYGLKQAPRAWFEKFRTTLLHLAFTQSQYFFARLPLGSLYFLCMSMIL